MLQLEIELQEIAVALSETSLSYALIGELAVGMYTRPRPTFDIDLLILEAEWDSIVSVFNNIGFESLVKPRIIDDFEIRRLIKKFPRSTESLAVDFLIASTDELMQVLNQRKSVLWNQTKLYFADREGLIYTRKLRGTRQDLKDVEALSIRI